MRLDFSSVRPDEPTDNCFIETFNGSPRNNCLNVHWFTTFDETKAIVEAWRVDDSESRPHVALDGVPPGEFARWRKDLEVSSTDRAAEN